MNYSLKDFNYLCELRGLQYDLVHRVIIDFGEFVSDVIWGDMKIKELKDKKEEAKKNNDKLLMAIIEVKMERIREIREFAKVNNFKYGKGEDTIIKWFELFKKWYEKEFKEDE